jgi:hypothetical protein
MSRDMLLLDNDDFFESCPVDECEICTSTHSIKNTRFGKLCKNCLKYEIDNEEHDDDKRSEDL